MATILKEMPKEMAKRYPWNEWLDGQPRKLDRGKDFTVSIRSFRAVAALAGTVRGLKVRAAKLDENTIAIQATKQTKK